MDRLKLKPMGKKLRKRLEYWLSVYETYLWLTRARSRTAMQFAMSDGFTQHEVSGRRLAGLAKKLKLKWPGKRLPWFRAAKSFGSKGWNERIDWCRKHQTELMGANLIHATELICSAGLKTRPQQMRDCVQAARLPPLIELDLVVPKYHPPQEPERKTRRKKSEPVAA